MLHKEKNLQTSEIITTLSEHLPALQKEFGIQKIGLFGSHARNQSSFKSDVDLVYVLREGASMDFKSLVELENYLKTILGVNQIAWSISAL